MINIEDLPIKDLPRVENMVSNAGNLIANQFLLKGKGYTLFKSYDSPIALIDCNNKVYIFSDWNYSTTTGKYRNIFLSETKPETLKKLKSGEYTPVGWELWN
mgnify:CR=1 FL=1